jgi:hypothetical protein
MPNVMALFVWLVNLLSVIMPNVITLNVVASPVWVGGANKR